VLTFFLGVEFEIAGPWRLFVHIRHILKVSSEQFNDQTGEWVEVAGDGFFADLFSCFWCLATWISAIVCILTAITFNQPWYFCPYEWLANIAVAGIVYIYRIK
jgi:hypothetical protein